MVVITHYQRLLNFIVPDRGARDGARADPCTRAARSLPWSWKKPATPHMTQKRLKGRR